MIEDWWDLLKFREPRYDVVVDDSGAVFFCLLVHVLPEEVVEFEVEFEVDDEELVPDRLDRTGRLAFGAGVGMET